MTASGRGPGFDAAWSDLGLPGRRCLGLAWASYVAGGLAVGSVLTDAAGEIVAEGRNRAYDPPGGPDVLQGSPLAHAEMNVLAAVPEGRALGHCTLWSTQEPCSMCTAAAAFTGVGTVRYLAPDPWAIATGVSRGNQPTGDEAATTGTPRMLGPGTDRWVVAANLLFLGSVAARDAGLDHPTIERNRVVEPETTRIVADLVARRSRSEITPETSIETFLVGLWVSIEAAAAARTARAGGA